MTLDRQWFLRYDHKTQATKGKIDRASAKCKTFVLQRTWSRKWKGNPQNGRKYLQMKIFVSDTVLVSRIYKEPFQLSNKNMNNPIWKWAKGLNWHFSKEDLQMAKKHKKRCSTSLTIKEVQIKATMRYYFITTRMAIIKKTSSTKCWWGLNQMLEKLNPHTLLVEMQHNAANLEKSL